MFALLIHNLVWPIVWFGTASGTVGVILNLSSADRYVRLIQLNQTFQGICGEHSGGSLRVKNLLNRTWT